MLFLLLACSDVDIKSVAQKQDEVQQPETEPQAFAMLEFSVDEWVMELATSGSPDGPSK